MVYSVAAIKKTVSDYENVAEALRAQGRIAEAKHAEAEAKKWKAKIKQGITGTVFIGGQGYSTAYPEEMKKQIASAKSFPKKTPKKSKTIEEAIKEVKEAPPKTEFVVGEKGQEQSISREKLLETLQESKIGISKKAKSLYSKMTPMQRFQTNVRFGVIANPIEAGSFIYKSFTNKKEAQKMVMKKLSRELEYNPTFNLRKAFVSGAKDAFQSIYAQAPLAYLGGKVVTGIGRLPASGVIGKAGGFAFATGVGATSGYYVGKQSGEFVKEVSKKQYGRAFGRAASLGVVSLSAYAGAGGTGEKFASELRKSEKGTAYLTKQKLKPPKVKFKTKPPKVKEELKDMFINHLEKTIKKPTIMRIGGKKYLIQPVKTSAKPVWSSKYNMFVMPSKIKIIELPETSPLLLFSQKLFLSRQKTITPFYKQTPKLKLIPETKPSQRIKLKSGLKLKSETKTSQVIKPVTIQQYKSMLKHRTKQKSLTGLVSLSKTLAGTKSKTLTVTKTQTLTRTLSKSMTTSATKMTTLTKTGLMSRGYLRAKTKISRPVGFGGFPPLIFGFGKSKPKKRFRRMKRLKAPRKYTPSLIGISIDKFISKPPKYSTGFGIRFRVKKKKRKKKLIKFNFKRFLK